MVDLTAFRNLADEAQRTLNHAEEIRLTRFNGRRDYAAWKRFRALRKAVIDARQAMQQSSHKKEE